MFIWMLIMACFFASMVTPFVNKNFSVVVVYIVIGLFGADFTELYRG